MIDTGTDVYTGAPEAPEALEDPTPEAPEAPEAPALVILIPEGVREVRLDASSLELWLDVLEWQYKSIKRTELTDMVIGGLKVFVRLVLFGLTRYPQPGWTEQPPRERHSDILPYAMRYIIGNAFNVTIARKWSRMDLGVIVQAQAAAALMKAQAIENGIPGGLSGALARHASNAAAGLSAGTPDANGTSQASGEGTGAARSDASGSLEAEEPKQERRRRAFGIRRRGS